MASHFKCSGCGNRIVVKFVPGEIAQCPECGKIGTVPDDAAEISDKEADSYLAALSKYSTPQGRGARIKYPVPEFVYWIGTLLIIAGLIGLFLALNHRIPYHMSLLIPAGVLFMVFGTIIYGNPVSRGNFVLAAVSRMGWVFIIAAILTGVLIFAGAFDPQETAFYGFAAFAAFITGIAGVYYGENYQRSAAGMTIGRELGFADADSGLAKADGVYDSKCRMNGVETLFDIDQKAYTPASAVFTLAVLCRCANPLGVTLKIKPEDALGGALAISSLPKLPPIPHWDWYDVRCNLGEAVINPLTEAKRGGNVFTDKAGFLELTLTGNEFNFMFRRSGYPDAAYVKRVLEEVTRLAAGFN